MPRHRFTPLLACSCALSSLAAPPKLDGVGAAMQAAIDAREIAGAVTVVATKDKILHLEATGFADLASRKPIEADMMAWIASMTKPITGVALLMLQDEGSLQVTDRVAKYLPEFARLKTPSGKPAELTIVQIMTHTSGLGEIDVDAVREAKSLSDLIPLFLAAPMQFEPGTKWNYSQAGINTGARIVEVVSGMSFDAFLQERLFGPLGMKDTTFYPTDAQRARMITPYAKDATTGELEVAPPRGTYGQRDRPPRGSGGLFSTALDYTRFCQMLLNRGTFEGTRFLSERAMELLTTPQTGDLACGFFQPRYGANYGWAIGTCVLRTPHPGVAAMLSPGTYGHGGAWGTQAWIDPLKGVVYLMIIQRAGFPNSDGSEVRRAFQTAAEAALTTRRVGI